MRKKTLEEVLEQFHKIHGNEYDYSEVEYNGNLQKVKIYCKKCKKYFYQTPKCHLRGHGCPTCSLLKIGDKLRKTTENFIKEAQLKYNNKFDYSKVNYINSNIKVKIHCNECNNTFEQTPSNHLKFGCSCCGIINSQKKRRTGKEKFIEQAEKINGKKFDYHLVEYVNTDTKVKIICNKCHNILEQTPHSHLKGYSCPYCYQTEYIKELLLKFKNIHRNNYDYSKLKYIGYDKKVEIICNKCRKSFWVTPGDHIKGHGCPYCQKSHGEFNILKILIDNNIKFEQQKRFNDCKDKSYLPFDFYLPDLNICIEYQGRQHYREGIGFFIAKRKSKEKAEEAYRTLKLHDKIKKKYCKEHNIKLLEIKYCDNIEKKLNKIIKSIK